MIHSIIIDDEHPCIKSLQSDLLKNCQMVEVADTCFSAKDGIMSIKKTILVLFF